MSLEAKREKILHRLQLLPGTDEQLAYLISCGRKYPPLDDALRTDDRLLPGCVSRLWLAPEIVDGRCIFHMDADAQISKGIASIICEFYNNETPEDILGADAGFLAEAGVTQHLSPNRSNGLASLVAHIRKFAAEAAASSLKN